MLKTKNDINQEKNKAQGVKSTLILGGARSGKSRTAEQHATESDLEVVYLATATTQDEEMRQRIAKHQQQRPAHWELIEEPIFLAKTLQQEAQENRCILVDCLTLWLTNLLLHEDSRILEREKSALLKTLPNLPGKIILVSNETGLGVVPADPLSRQFCDEAGFLHQQLAQICDRVIWMVAGLPQIIKREFNSKVQLIVKPEQ